AFQNLQDLSCDVDIVGPSASLGYVLMATLTWGCVVWGILAVNGCSVADCTGSPGIW
ncbi:hypothetical protein N321_07819, partial [Antrostomus carolinensis]